MICVLVPMRSGENTDPAEPTTVTASSSAASEARSTLTAVTWFSCRKTFSVVSGSKPGRSTVTV